MRRSAIVVTALLSSVAAAQPQVPAGFTVRQIAPLFDGIRPKVFAIDDPAFGTGVLTAVVTNGVATIRLVDPSGLISPVGVWTNAPQNAGIATVRLDAGIVIDGLIHFTVSDTSTSDAHYLTMDAAGLPLEQWERTNAESYRFEFTDGTSGQPTGAVLIDANATNGTFLTTMDTAFNTQVVSTNSVPQGRTDTDIAGMRRDSTGLYGGGLLLADDDVNTDGLAAIYELREATSGGVYRAIFGPISTTIKQYADLDIAAAGSLGGVIFVTEKITDEIQQVAPDGTHSTWATGFVGIGALSISPDGESMYVADLNGVWLIRPEGIEPGPAVLATDPSASGGTVLSGSPVNALRVIFTEPVSFTDSDVTITNSDGQPVGFDASGSGSQFMIIGLAEPLSGNSYTVIIADTLTSVATGQPLDGDNDGVAGTNAVLTFTHACAGDIADDFGTPGSDGMVSFGDFLALLGLIGPCE